MLSLMTFGAGFLMRPIGAIVLGAYIDRYGRRAGTYPDSGADVGRNVWLSFPARVCRDRPRRTFVDLV